MRCACKNWPSAPGIVKCKKISFLTRVCSQSCYKIVGRDQTDGIVSCNASKVRRGRLHDQKADVLAEKLCQDTLTSQPRVESRCALPSRERASERGGPIPISAKTAKFWRRNTYRITGGRRARGAGEAGGGGGGVASERAACGEYKFCAASAHSKGRKCRQPGSASLIPKVG